MAKTGMIIITNPNKLNKLIPRISNEVKNTLYVQFFPPKKIWMKNLISNYKLSSTPRFIESIIGYYKFTADLQKLDVRILLGAIKKTGIDKIPTKKPIDIIYFDEIMNDDEIKRLLSYIENKTPNCQTSILHELVNDQLYDFTPVPLKTYNSVVLGGTFDRLHNGHKILLSEAVLKCEKKLTIGVTDTNMLKSKKLWELIEPCDVRINKVKDFLQDIEPDLEYNVIPIYDMYGTTTDEPSYEMLVVSAETINGGKMINEIRVRNGLKPLKICSVDLIPDIKLDEEEEDKISSSNNRLRLLGTLFITPEPNIHIPSQPYVIGLTGGIASGKSSISKKLRTLGAGVIDCDKIAHQLYQAGSEIYDQLIQVYGTGILGKNGEVNRKALGEIVFNNKEMLHKLNNILWPTMLEKSKQMSNELLSYGHSVVVLEAAVLFQAGWEKYCHEIWVCLIPHEEAVKRLQLRNGMSINEAHSRLSVQQNNVQLVSKANVIFSTQWRTEYTKKQVERAWNDLKRRVLY